MRRLIALVALAGLVAPGCSDSSTGPPVGFEMSVQKDGGFAPLEPCQTDSQCLSGHCLDLGGTSGKRCVAECETDKQCPQMLGWSCQNKACTCTDKGKTDACNTDGDCDGVVDHTPFPEICNDKDDDCNGKVDDVKTSVKGSKIYYRDADGDGFGNALEQQYFCKDQPGWVDNSSDCDDTHKEDNPDAKEICGDTRDNDCDGTLEDVDVCGLTPIEVPDATDNKYASAQIKSCGVTANLDKTVDITEIVAKQDKTRIRFTVRLAGPPAGATCSTYKLAFGDPAKTTDDLVYIFRLAAIPCGSTPQMEVFVNGQPISPASTVVTGFNASDPGHVSFTIDKAELFAHTTNPTYRIRACTALTANPSTDIDQCASDDCDALLHR
ncbi:MAG: putative metal-binding motif-containing protein [Myxococcales bacterium]|nr:putative metal-binding motif-containing protein [Myxococcales bacterium]